MTLGNEKILIIEKNESLERALWRTCFGRGCGPVARHTT
jgi:hypothetical protein